MSDHSKIEWTDASWNPIRGCSRVSEGCRNCYAERIAARFSGLGQPYEGLAIMQEAGHFETAPRWTGDVRFIPELLDQPLHWRRPRKIFVNSMSDLFHEGVTDQNLFAIFAVMCGARQHTFQILTKRAERMRKFLSMEIIADKMRKLGGWPTSHIWLGVSVEDQKTADVRIPLLLQTPAAVRWVSYEPALGPVDFSAWPKRVWLRVVGDDGSADRGRIDWVVAGGESGPGARPAHPDWFRSARDQCMEAGVPFFFKQWGEWLNISQLKPAYSDEELDRISFKTVVREYHEPGKPPDLADLYFRVGKKRAGHLLDGIPWREFPKTNGTMP